MADPTANGVEPEVETGTGSVIMGMDAAMTRHPQATYRALREAGPVLRIEGADGATIVTTSRTSEEEVLRHPEIYTSSGNAGSMGTERALIPLEIDPPVHRAWRRIVDPIFSPQRMALLEGPIEQLVHGLIDDFGDATEIDFAQQFSVPFPSQVFLAMIGLPLDDLPHLLAMKDGIMRAHVVLGTHFDDPRCQAFKEKTADEIFAYFGDALDAREQQRTDDVLSDLLDAEIDGRPLTRDELLEICFPLLLGGLDTVSATLDCFFAYLAEHPDHRRQIVDDPSIVRGAVEELFRYETPLMMTPRVVAGDAILAGCPVQAGDTVYMLHGVSNLDLDGLPDADEVRFDRDGNRHLSFGGGPHRCLGSHLARLELRVALRVWHERIPDYRIAPGVELEFTPVIRATDTFPMVLGESL
ncbi:MAG TPA: cytochrome P450 [Acidimicrobiales bacterium]